MVQRRGGSLVSSEPVLSLSCICLACGGRAVGSGSRTRSTSRGSRGETATTAAAVVVDEKKMVMKD